MQPIDERNKKRGGLAAAGFGSGDDVMISSDDNSVDKVNGGDDFDDCLFGAGDEVNNCEY